LTARKPRTGNASHDGARSAAARTRPKDRADQIVRAAAHLFRQHGYPAVSINDIGESVGVSGAGLYRHFDSKQAVLVAAYARAIGIFQAIDDAVAVQKAAPGEGLATLHRRELEAAIADLDLAAIYLREARHIQETPPTTRDALRDHIRLWVDALAAFRPDLSVAQAHFMVRSLSGLTSSLLYYRPQLAPAQTVDLLACAFHGAVVAPPLAADRRVDASAPVGSLASAAKQPRREEIFSAAVRLFREKGFGGVGIDDIGRRAGIAGPSVYRHFSSKDDILAAIFERGYERTMTHTHRVLLAAAGPDEALHGLAESYVEQALDNADLVVVYMTERHALPRQLELAARRDQQRYVKIWMDLLGQARPELAEPQAQALVHGAIGIINAGARNAHLVDAAVARASLAAMASGVLRSS
jgi:AcrR family transcriptional regulator